jgi:hypothetical protein
MYITKDYITLHGDILHYFTYRRGKNMALTPAVTSYKVQMGNTISVLLSGTKLHIQDIQPVPAEVTQFQLKIRICEIAYAKSHMRTTNMRILICGFAYSNQVCKNQV